MNTTINPAQEFDELVKNYTNWLKSCEDPSFRRRQNWRAFLRGMGSVLNIFGSYTNPLSWHPVYGRSDLTPEQIDAVSLASTWQRVNNALDKVLSGESDEVSVEEAIAGKALVKNMCENYRNIYVSHAVRK